MNPSRRVGVIGGTFDPIHVGHLAAARAAQQALALDEVIFIPSSDPPHRPDKPRASGYHRMQMTTLAVAGVPGWRVSDIELDRPGASFTFDTLTALRAADRGAQFFFILGADAFAEIATWYRYPAVLDLAQFVVIARPGAWPSQADLTCPPELQRRRNVRLYEDPPSEDRQSKPVHFVQCETPNVSSTEIRRRVGASESIHGLVPDLVEQFIVANRLYGGRSHEPRA